MGTGVEPRQGGPEKTMTHQIFSRAEGTGPKWEDGNAVGEVA